MSIDFNGTTSLLYHTTATGYLVDARTVLAWCYADTAGELGVGQLFGADETAAGTVYRWVLRYNNSTNLFRMFSNRTTDGVWQVALPLAQWNAFGVSYDGSDVANDPVARNNFAPLTVTEITVPVGAEAAGETGYAIGCRSTGTNVWDGAIQHVQFFNVVLTAAEMDAALRLPGSIRRGLVSWWPMLTAAHVTDIVQNVAGTGSALTSRGGPPCGPVHRRSKGYGR